MNTIRWNTFSNVDCDSFNVYRSVAGLVINFPNSLVAGDVLKFLTNYSDLQQITLVATDADSIAALFNARAVGAKAEVNEDGTQLVLRALGNKPRFDARACTFLDHTLQTPRVIVPKLEWNLVGNVPVTDLTQVSYMFEDENGSQFDSYRITSVTNSIESLPTVSSIPELSVENLCYIEGRIVNAQNRPVVGLNITTRIATPYGSCLEDVGVAYEYRELQVKTDSFGRFQVKLPRKQQYLFQIEAIGYNWVVDVPDQPYAGLLELVPTYKYLFSPFGDPQ